MGTRKRGARTKPRASKISDHEKAVTTGRTVSGLPLAVVAETKPSDAREYLATLGFPGERPFTRGIRATMYRGRLWTMRQYAGFGTAKETNRRSTYIYPPAPSMRLALDVIEFCSREVPRWNAISVSGYHIREAGSTAAQEIGFTLANAIAYLEAAVSRGLDVDAIVPQISFFFNAHIDLLEEVAKFRAARRLWASIMAERFHAKEPESLELRFHAQTAGAALTAQQPENNAVRVAIQALAAVLGGAQSLHTNSMDEALSLPTEKAVRVALRTQQLLAHERGVANLVDTVGGSFTIESLTDR